MKDSLYISYFASPIGVIEIIANQETLLSVQFRSSQKKDNANRITDNAKTQLKEYFDGQRKTFSLPISFQGTDFQQIVFSSVLEIPFGMTQSYGQLASNLGDLKKVRAVGSANGKNPILIIIPCHRVIGSSGDLVGYAGGLDKKEWLLRHEGAITQQSLFP